MTQPQCANNGREEGGHHAEELLHRKLKRFDAEEVASMRTYGQRASEVNNGRSLPSG